MMNAEELRLLLVDCESLLGLIAHRKVTDQEKKEADELSWRVKDAIRDLPALLSRSTVGEW